MMARAQCETGLGDFHSARFCFMRPHPCAFRAPVRVVSIASQRIIPPDCTLSYSQLFAAARCVLPSRGLMTRTSRWTIGVACLSALMPTLAFAQQAATVSGRVRGEAGNPLPGANVAITDLGVGAVVRENGDYSFVVPAN